MKKRIAATEAVRRFFEILGSVKCRGKRYVIMRGKEVAARISPHEEGARRKMLRVLKALIKRLPKG